MKLAVLLIRNISRFERQADGCGNGYHNNLQNSYRRKLDNIQKGQILAVHKFMFTNLL